MPWYKAGTVSVAQNSNAVTGTGTSFIANSRVGDAFLGPDGRWYEVTNIASNTAMSISPNYLGATAGAGTYALAPMQGYVKDSADALRALVNQFGTKLAALGTTGNYDILPVNKGGTGASDGPSALINLGGQAKANSLSALSFPSFAADQLPYFTSNSTAGLASFTAFGRSFVDDATPAAGRATLQLGAAAVAAIAGVVGQSGGTPTGAIIETATNGAGTYTKFADGTMICRTRLSAQRTLNKAAGALFFDVKEGQPAYPAPFVGFPQISIQVTGFTYEVLWLGAGWTNPTTNWPAGYAMTESARAQSDLVYFDYVAHGRWF